MNAVLVPRIVDQFNMLQVPGVPATLTIAILGPQSNAFNVKCFHVKLETLSRAPLEMIATLDAKWFVAILVDTLHEDLARDELGIVAIWRLQIFFWKIISD